MSTGLSLPASKSWTSSGTVAKPATFARTAIVVTLLTTASIGASIASNSMTTVNSGVSNGRVIFLNFFQDPAPSISAAS